MSLTSQAVSGVKWNAVATFTKVGVQFISLAVLAHLLDPGDFGLMSMAIVVTGFAQAFADFGFSAAIIHRQDTTHDQLSSLYWVSLIVGFGLFGLIFLSIPFVVAFYQEPGLVPVLRWSAASFLLLPFGQQFQTLMRRDLRFRELSLIQVTQSIAYAFLAIALAWKGFGVMSLVWGTLFQTLVATLLLIWIAARSGWLPSFHFQGTDLNGFLQFGFYQMGERSLNFLSSNIDYLLIGRLLGSEPLGYYTLAFNLMRLPLAHINPVIVSVAFPAFARIQHQDDVLRRGYAKVLHFLSAAIFPIMAGLFVAAPLFVPLVYGAEWLPAVPIVQVFCLMGALKSLGNPLGSLLLAKGRADLGFWMNVIGVVGYGISNVVGARWGILGVALSSLIFSCIILWPVDFYLRWLVIRMTAGEYWQAIKPPTVATLGMLIVIIPLYYLLASMSDLGSYEIMAVVILVLTGALVYASMIRLLDRPLLLEVWGYLRPTSTLEV